MEDVFLIIYVEIYRVLFYFGFKILLSVFKIDYFLLEKWKILFYFFRFFNK